MDKKTRNRIGMFKSVASILKTNSSKLTAYPIIGTALTELEGIISEIDSMDKGFKKRTMDETLQKEILKEELISKIVKISAALYVYGVRNQVAELIVKTKLRKNDLERLTNVEFNDKCLALLSYVGEHKEELASYGITEEVITAAQEAYDNYKKATDEQSDEFANRSSDKKKLDELVKECNNKIKNELDPFMEIFEDEDPDLFNAYQSARVIKDLGMKSSTEEGAGSSEEQH